MTSRPEMPRVSFHQISSKVANSAARKCQIRTSPTHTVETPTMIVSTTRKCVPNLTPDLFARTLAPSEFFGLFIHLEALLEDEHTSSSSPCTGMGTSSPGVLHGYGEQHPLIVAVDEPTYYAGIPKKSGGEISIQNGPDWLSVYNVSGVTTFNLHTQLQKIINHTRPTIFFSPTDHYQRQNARLKTIKKSTLATQRFFELSRQHSTTNPSTLTCPSLVIHGHCTIHPNEEALVRLEMDSRTEAAKLQSPIFVSVLCSKESAPAIVSSFPNAVRCFRGAVTPEEIIYLSRVGFDIFESSHASTAAENGVAIITGLDRPTERLCMQEAIFFDDFSPLDPHCQCIACSGPDKTTKSYIHHLFISHEMLATVFLTSHNLWQYARLLAQIRVDAGNGN